jgi:hypothetical protein
LLLHRRLLHLWRLLHLRRLLSHHLLRGRRRRCSMAILLSRGTANQSRTAP